MIKENKSKILLILASAALLASAVFVTSCASAQKPNLKKRLKRRNLKIRQT